jgi:glutaredoxin/glutathione-dependent peroxiredoxin
MNSAFMKCSFSAVRAAGQAARHQQSIRTTGIIAGSTRPISVGTDMRSSVISLQKARPWFRCNSGSNKAEDNSVTLKELFPENKTVAFFGVPAPFTGTCTHEHYPSYAEAATAFYDSGIDEIICYSVADPYAHHGWALSMQNNFDKISFFADPDASFARAYGVDSTYDAVSLGLRSKRFSMIVQDGVVTVFRLVDNAATDAVDLLAELQELKENGDVSRSNAL